MKKGRLIYWVLLLLLAPLGSVAQLDSLQSVIVNPPNDTADINALYTLAKLQLRADPKASIASAHEMATRAEQRDLRDWAALGLRTIGSIHFIRGRQDSSIHYFELARTRLGAPENNPRIGVGLLVNIGNFHMRNGANDKAVANYTTAYDLAKGSGYERDVPKIINNLGVVYRRMGHYGSAARAYAAALELKEGDNDSLGMAETLCNLAVVNFHRRKNELAEENLAQASQLYQALGFPGEVASMKLVRGVSLYEQGDFSGAKDILVAGLSQPEEGIDIYFLVIAYLSLGDIYRQEGNTEEALRYLKEGHIAANQLRLKPQLSGYERALGLTYAAAGDHEKANRYFERFAKSIDTLAQVRQVDAHNETLEKFQAELREGQIARQKLLISQQQQQQQLLWFLLGSLGLVAIGGYLVFQSRLQFQRSEARRKESERLAEVTSLQQAAELGNLRSMIDGQEKERKRVAKDLHDGLGGLLATVKARLSAEASTSPEANRLIDRACTEVRRIAHNMMPQTLALSGLTGSVQDIVGQLNQRGLETELEIVGQPDLRLDHEGQAMLLRIIQELTHNVVKHAGASKLFIQLLDQPQQLMLTVEDDGKGFNLAHHQNKPNGIGLANIANRVSYLNGTIQYDSSPGHGTTITLTLPL